MNILRFASSPIVCGVAFLSVAHARQTTFTDTILYTVPTGSAQFGDRITRGDVDGDGILDLAIADTAYDWKGRIWIFHGPSFSVPMPVWIPNSQVWDFAGFNSGFELIDLNADGLDDLMFGASSSKAGGTITQKGRAFVSYAPDFQTTIELQHPVPDTPWGTYFGAGMVAFDQTGDGILDILVSSPGWGEWVTPTTVINGRIDVYSGTTGFAGPSAYTYTQTPSPSTHAYGWMLLLADYDGIPPLDLLTSDGDWDAGIAMGFSWFQNGAPTPTLTFGASPISIASPYRNPRYEDVTGDGLGDLISSSWGSNGGVLLIPGGPSGGAMEFEPVGSKDFGRGLDVGDVNRDGVNDFVAGDPDYDLGSQTATGRVIIYYGPDFSLTQTFFGAHAHAEFGTGILVHDFDGDGFEEVFVGAGGEFGGSLHRFRHETLRATGATSLSLASGGSAPLALDVGAESGNRPYLVLASLSGSSPGLDLPAAGGLLHLSLNLDAFTFLAMPLANSPYFVAFQGVTTGKGKATPTFVVPPNTPDPGIVGLDVTFAAIVAGPSGAIAYTTDAVAIQFAP